MKKKIALLFLCIFGILCFTPFFAPQKTVSADTGPKPSVRITFENLSGETCYGTLLSLRESTGPHSVWNGDPERAYYGRLPQEIWQKFVEYKDSDGYYFLQFGDLVSETNTLNWTYYPPRSFKVLLYFPDSDTFLSSGIYERYAFDSYFNVTVGEDSVLSAQKSYDYTWEIISLLCRIVITILLELGVALLFGYREKRAVLSVLCVNAVTQIILNVILNVINYTSGALEFVIFYILLEFLVFAVEAIAYSLLFRFYTKKRSPVWKSILYAFVANALSFGAGFGIALLIPGIF